MISRVPVPVANDELQGETVEKNGQGKVPRGIRLPLQRTRTRENTADRENRALQDVLNVHRGVLFEATEEDEAQGFDVRRREVEGDDEHVL